MSVCSLFATKDTEPKLAASTKALSYIIRKRMSVHSNEVMSETEQSNEMAQSHISPR